MRDDQSNLRSDQGSDTTKITPAATGEDLEFQQLLRVAQERRNALGIVEAPPQPNQMQRLMARLAEDSRTPEQREAERVRQLEADSRRLACERQNRFRTVMEGRSRYVGCRLGNYVVECDAQREAVAKLTSYAEDMPARVADGQSLVIYGPVGTGKDHLMAAMVHAAVVHYGISVKWRDGMAMFGAFRDRIESEQRSEESLIRSFVSPAVLAISDPMHPSEPLTPYQSMMLFRVIDGRYSERRPTWITMNATGPDEAEGRMSAQIVDRIRHGALSVKCFWPSFRKGSK